MDIHQWGFINKCKWVLVDAAPLTGSGLNEIVAAAETKAKLKQIAKLLGYRITGRNAYWEIVRLDSIKDKEPDPKREEPMLVGSPEHDQFCADECLKRAVKDEQDRLADELDRLNGY